MSRIEGSWFVVGMIKATTDMWLKGWNERNGGNISLRLMDSDVEPYLGGRHAERILPLSEAIPELAGQTFLVTGTGKYFRNVQLDPEETLGIIRILTGGASLEVLWGFVDGGGPTSELPAHLKSHRARQQANAGRTQVIMHCHATNLLAISYVLDFSTANVTRALWEGSTECLVVFPEGVGTMEWIVPGTDEIGHEKARLMARHTLVLWPHHGVFAAGETLDEDFGLIDTAEKSAEILTKVPSMGGHRRTITRKHLRDLAKCFGVEPLPEALALDGWRLAERRS
jgi:rhamnulose-1-phosphate aldolase